MWGCSRALDELLDIAVVAEKLIDMSVLAWLASSMLLSIFGTLRGVTSVRLGGQLAVLPT